MWLMSSAVCRKQNAREGELSAMGVEWSGKLQFGDDIRSSVTL